MRNARDIGTEPPDDLLQVPTKAEILTILLDDGKQAAPHGRQMTRTITTSGSTTCAT